MTRLGVLLLLFAAACGREMPSRPTPISPVDSSEPQTGPQWLELFGFGLSNDPRHPACVPPFVPRDGTNVTTTVTLTHEGREWVARAMEPALGNISLRFHETGRSLAGKIIAGTIRGWAVNVPIFIFELPRDVRVSLAGPGGRGAAEVEGTIPPLAPLILGSISGDVRFSDRSVTSWSRCTEIQWLLQPKT